MTSQAENIASPSVNTRLAPDTDVTRAATAFIQKTDFSDIPDDVLTIARRCILDTVGLYATGLDEESTRIAVLMAKEDGGREDSFLLGSGITKVPVHVAARALGISAHAHDFDDTQVSHDPAHVYGLLTHPSTAPLSAALAVSDFVNEQNPERFLAAFCIGFEVSCKISEWMLPDHYLRGHHSSGTVATFGAAASSGWLLRLNEEQMGHAIGIAASMAAGVRCSFGTMCKPWHVARASENGVMAAMMARRGFTGDPTALDGRWGFASILAGGFSPDKLEEGFGNTWSMLDPGVSIKPYPSGILTHQAMDMVRNLANSEDIDPEQVDRIEFFAGDNILNPIRYPIAANGLQAKFSMAALISMLVLYRKAGLPEFRDDMITSPEFQAMQHRVTTNVDPKINAMGFDLIRSRIAITMKGGHQFTANADTRYRGGPQLPMSDDDLLEKFTACCTQIAPDVQSELEVSIKALPEAGSLQTLLSSLIRFPTVA